MASAASGFRFDMARPWAAGGPVLVFDDAPAAPEGLAWLGSEERARANAMRVARRRESFLAGRFVLHRLLARELLGEAEPDAATLARFDVRAQPEGAPIAWLDGAPCPCVVALSHREGAVLAAVAAPGTLLGCDLERDEPRSETFLADYLDAEEQARARAHPEPARSRVVTATWSAKESLLKALGLGLRVDTREVPVRWQGPPGDAPLRARLRDGPWMAGEGRARGPWLATMVAAAPHRT